MCTSAGIDKSNVSKSNERLVTLLPKDPDNSAKIIKNKIKEKLNKDIAVIINDSMGREYRKGAISESIGISGIKTIETDEKKDLFNNSTRPQIALIDELASGASILMGEADEKCPIVLIKGVKYTKDDKCKISDILK